MTRPPTRAQLDRILELAPLAEPDETGQIPDGEELVGLARAGDYRMAQAIIRHLVGRIPPERLPRPAQPDPWREPRLYDRWADDMERAGEAHRG